MAQRQYDIVSTAPGGAGLGGRSVGFSEIVAESVGGAIGSSIVRLIVDDGNATAAAGTGTGSMGGRAEIRKCLEILAEYILVQTYPDT